MVLAAIRAGRFFFDFFSHCLGFIIFPYRNALEKEVTELRGTALLGT